MKRTYVTPTMVSEEFVTNQCVAACYYIECNVPQGTGYFETNGVAGLQRYDSWTYKADTKIRSGEGCGTKSTLVVDGNPTPAYWATSDNQQLSSTNAYYFRARPVGQRPGFGTVTYSDHFSYNLNYVANASN